jgi:hypothetical protein
MIWNQYKVVDLLKDIKKHYGEEELYSTVEEVYLNYAGVGKDLDDTQLGKIGIERMAEVLKEYDCYDEYENFFEDDYADGGETDDLIKKFKNSEVIEIEYERWDKNTNMVILSLRIFKDYNGYNGEYITFEIESDYTGRADYYGVKSANYYDNYGNKINFSKKDAENLFHNIGIENKIPVEQYISEKIEDNIDIGRSEREYADGGETDTLRIEIEEDRDGYEVNYQFDDYEITGVLEKYYTGRGNDYKFIPSYFADKGSEDYYNDNWEDVEDEILSVFHSKFKKGGQVKKRKKYGEGGSVEQGNLEMMKNQAIQVKHHADELIEALKQNPRIDAWVVSLMDRATQNLSNITHYLDGELKHFAKGGMMMKKGGKIHYSYTNAHGYMVYRDGKALESFKTEEQAKRFIKRIERK